MWDQEEKCKYEAAKSEAQQAVGKVEGGLRVKQREEEERSISLFSRWPGLNRSGG